MGLTVIIVGAGIGGLAAAIALRQAGHQVTVLEKYENKREVGFAVSVPPNSTRVLRSFGLDFQKARMSQFGGMDFVKADMYPFRILRREPVEGANGAPSLAAHRVDLHNALREMATGEEGHGVPVEVREGVRVEGYDPEAGSVMLDDGSVMSADLVVAADGVKSRAHVSILGEERPATLSGLSNVRFCMSTETLESDPQLKETLLNAEYPTIYRGTAQDVVLFRYPCRDNTLHNFGCYHLSPTPLEGTTWRSQTTRHILADRLASFDPRIQRIAHLADADDMYLWKVADRDPLPAFHKGKMILLGDAAHPMQPTFGQGASFSIEDAGTLGIVLQNVHAASQVPERLQLWESLRRQRCGAIQLFSNTTSLAPYGLDEGTKAKLRDIWPEEGEWPEISRPGVSHWCYRYDCLGEAKKAVEERFGGGESAAVQGRL